MIGTGAIALSLKISANCYFATTINFCSAIGVGGENVPSGEYFKYGLGRDPILFGPEMSKRSRAIELWATLKYLGKNGVDQMVTGFNDRARQLAAGLAKHGFQMLNEVVFNQVLIAGRDEAHTQSILDYVQKSGELWCGGTTWQGKAAIRISICSWVTDEEDIQRSLVTFKEAFSAPS